MRIKYQKPNKIVLYFLLGIVVPCILLSYFAYRGVRNESAFLERRTINEHQNTANLIINQIDNFITKEASDLNNYIQQFERERNSIDSDSRTTSSFKPALIHSIFSIDSHSEFTFHYPKLLYLPDKENQDFVNGKISTTSQLFNQAHHLEYVEKNYKKTLEVCQSALSQNYNANIKSALWNTIARLQRKNAQPDKAILSYHNLIKKYGNLNGPGAISFGLAAHFELGSLYITVKDTLKAVEIYLDAYHNIVESTWNLQKSQFQFFLKSVGDSLKSLLSVKKNIQNIKYFGSVFDSLRNQLENKNQMTEYLLKFLKKGADILDQKIGDNIRNKPSGLFLEILDNDYLISLITTEELNADESENVWGVIWDIENFKNQYLRSLLENSLESNEAYWQVVNNNGNIILQSKTSEPGKKTVTINLVNNFPPWSIELFRQDPKLFEQILNLRRSIYFYILILVAGILGCGLILTSYSINREIELAQLKSEFVSTISHDLRSPLTSIRQMAEMLETGRVITKERRHKYYEVIVEQSEKLSLLINNILDSTKMEEKKRTFDFEVVTFEKLLNEILSTTKKRIHHEGFTLNIEIDRNLPEIVVDRSAISQAIANLVDNAIKFSNENKEINVRSFSESGYVVVEIQDFGIGIKDDEKNKIFNRFYRGSDESVRGRTKGSGLGLTLVKQIIDAHNGDVTVDSELGKGSTFTIKLPV